MSTNKDYQNAMQSMVHMEKQVNDILVDFRAMVATFNSGFPGKAISDVSLKDGKVELDIKVRFKGGE